MNLLEILPLLQGWSFVRINEEKDVEAGKDATLYESPDVEQGWLLGATFSSDKPDASLEITYNPAETGQTVDFSLSPGELYQAHKISPNRVSPYVGVYDDANNVYEAVFAPAVPFPLDGTIVINAVAGSNDASISADVQLVLITDVNAFTNGLRHLLGVTDVENYLYSALQQLTNLGKRPIEVELPAPPVPPAQPAKPAGSNYSGFLP